MQMGHSNDFQTPIYALNPLIHFLHKDWIIWECAEGNGNLVKHLEFLKFQVVGSDIKNGKDFLKWQPDKFDCIITNPPYSIKQQFLERCYLFSKPFALLLPLTTFETKKRQELFKKYGIQVIFFPYRINFETPNGKSSSVWFSTAWFTWGLDLPKDLIFCDVKPNTTLLDYNY